MSSAYHPELLAPYHRLDQGTNIQAECMSPFVRRRCLSSNLLS